VTGGEGFSDRALRAHSAHRAGTIAIVGRPNVGKSTLLNRLVGQKVSITSRRPQTTRHRVVGIVSRPDAQLVFVDTPGMQAGHGTELDRRMNRAAAQAIADVDVALVLVEALRFGAQDRQVLGLLPAGMPAVAAVNKIDLLKDKAALLPYLATLSAAFPFRAIVPVSAKTGRQTGELLDELAALLPEAPPLYAADDITDRSERFLAAELLREKLFRLLGAELPYAAAVQIERFETEGGLRRIAAAVLVDRPGHKAIVIGKGGEKLKAIATQARLDMEKLFGGKVFLEVWVKVRKGWMDDAALLERLGYD
jgi:GTP-binding protein Era